MNRKASGGLEIAILCRGQFNVTPACPNDGDHVTTITGSILADSPWQGGGGPVGPEPENNNNHKYS